MFASCLRNKEPSETLLQAVSDGFLIYCCVAPGPGTVWTAGGNAIGMAAGTGDPNDEPLNEKK